MKRFFGFALFFFIILISGNVLALNDCQILPKAGPPVNYSVVGFVTGEGHFALTDIGVPWMLVCDDRLVPGRSDVVESFRYADDFGQGHVSANTSYPGYSFWLPVDLGFTEPCRIVHESAGCGGDTCIFSMASNVQGHVSDCNLGSNRPFPNSYDYKLCCTPKEYCRDGVDNTGDGLIDCASPDCHASLLNFDVPQQCDPDGVPGNNQTTPDCISLDALGNVVRNPDCAYTDSFGDSYYYYCSYGEADDPSVLPGFCCPEGRYYDDSTGTCEQFTKCGIATDDRCTFNFLINRPQWFSKLYVGDVADWCYSSIPFLTNIGAGGPLRSEACCPIIHMSTYGFYVVDDNVKIFGAD